MRTGLPRTGQARTCLREIGVGFQKIAAVAAGYKSRSTERAV